MLTAPLVLAAAVAASFDLPPAVTKALDDGTFDATPSAFRIIALSHVADGCAARAGEDRGAARTCVQRALARAMQTRPAGVDLRSGEAGLWLTHLALILGAGDRTGGCLDHDLHRDVVEGLAKASLADPLGHAPSYAGREERWPADQAATLAALHRYDRAHGDHIAEAPLRKYREAIAERIDEDTQLPWSEARGVATGKLPRGCAVAWSVRYLAEVDPPLASSWWTAFVARYLVEHGALVGFREWPPGVDRPADVDSGPIVFGVGASATAFAIGAARAMHDDELAARLEGTAAVVGRLAALDESTAKVAGSTLAASIRFHASAPAR